jgi:predicted transposase YdaD
MATPSNPHDHLFRALLDDPERARTLLRDYLPDGIVRHFADAPPEPVAGSFVDDALRGSQSDRLFRVHLTSGRAAYVYALLEHKSAPDLRTPVQLLSYMARIWQRHLAGTETPAGEARRLPPIIPLVVYHGRAPWTVPTAVIDAVAADDALRPYLRDFRYVLAETREVPYDDLASERALRAGLAALTYAFGRKVTTAILARLVRDLPDGHPLQRQVLEYITQVYDVTEDTFRAAIRDARPEQEESLMATLAEQWKQEGRQEGKTEGKAEGKAETVLEILEARFGAIDPARRERVMRMSAPELSRLSARAITAPTLDDALAGAAHGQP